MWPCRRRKGLRFDARGPSGERAVGDGGRTDPATHLRQRLLPPPRRGLRAGPGPGGAGRLVGIPLGWWRTFPGRAVVGTIIGAPGPRRWCRGDPVLGGLRPRRVVRGAGHDAAPDHPRGHRPPSCLGRPRSRRMWLHPLRWVRRAWPRSRSGEVLRAARRRGLAGPSTCRPRGSPPPSSAGASASPSRTSVECS